MNSITRIIIAMVVGVIGLRAFAASAPQPVWQTSHRASVMINGGAMMNGDHFRDTVIPAMKKHFAGCKKIALVLYASHPDDCDRMEKRLQSAFADLGPDIVATSLHRFDEKGASKFLREADAIFVGGGETFVLLGTLYRTGQLDIIRKRVVKDGVPYFGVSAGSNIAGLIIGTTNDFPTGEVPSRTSLGLLPATVNPHHPESSDKDAFNGRAGKIRAYIRFNPTETVLALGNTAMVRLNAGICTVEIEPVWVYRAGQTTEYQKGSVVEFGGAKSAAPAPALDAPLSEPVAVKDVVETDTLQTQVSAPFASAPTVAVAAPTPNATPRPPAPTTAATAPTEPTTPAVSKNIWQQLGLAKDKDEPNWRDIPPMEARVIDWVSANSFKLDNGQVWEGEESIPYELKGKNISIAARPMKAFALSVEGKNTTVRVRRIK